jgi:Cu-Zn family superoxide dismutase
MVEAVCVITNGTISGFIEFKELKNRVKITIKLNKVPEGKHGFHIHRTGDLREGCKSLCSHYNPLNKKHGGKSSKERHVGDLGNIEANSKGEVDQVMYDSIIKLSGKYSIVGRSAVIHEKEDDLGKGDNEESLITGNAGKRIGCGVIGLMGDC